MYNKLHEALGIYVRVHIYVTISLDIACANTIPLIIRIHNMHVCKRILDVHTGGQKHVAISDLGISYVS